MIIVFLTLLALVLFSLVNSAKNTGRLSKSVTRFLISLILPLVTTAVIYYSNNRTVSFVTYHLYAIGTLLMRYYLVEFTFDFWGIRFRRTPYRLVFQALVLLDTLFILSNFVTGRLFTIDTEMQSYSILPTPLLMVHIALLYAMSVFAFSVYLRRILVISRLYAEKYIILLVGLLVVAGVEFFSVMTQQNIDLSVFAYALYGVLIYIFSLVHVPLLLTDRMLSQVVSRISDSIMFLDTEGECIYLNRAAGQLLGVARTDYKLAKEKLVEFIDAEEALVDDGQKLKKNITRNYIDFSYEVEFHRIYDSLGTYSGMFVSIRDRTEDERRLRQETYAANHDSLTGLYNREHLCRCIEKRLKEDLKTDYLIICSDILEFKLVNDIFGKEVGDQILINTARIMDASADGNPEIIYGRIGGDQFAVLMPKRMFNEKSFVDGAGDFSQINGDVFYPATIQFGVYEVKDRTIPVSIMFDRAYMAIESIKTDLQKRIAYYTGEMRDILLWEQQLTTHLDGAMRDNLIMPYLQPQVDTDGKVEGAEVLCRWDHTPQGIMVPENFIGILERNGMIVKLDYFMWESACKILKAWTARGKGNFYLSVNISPKDFYFIDVYEAITTLVEKYGIEPERLRLEITETVMMTDSELKFKIIERLRDRGFVVEMDDFGSGYSSLNMLKDLPVDIIKFDMLFLAETVHKERARTILRYMFEMANQLEIPVITEGVETQEQADFLAALGCNMFQGFFFSKPITLEAFEHTYF